MNNYLNLFFNSYTFKVVTIGCSLLAMISAIIGNFAVLKKESLLGDGVAHASLAGVCIAFLLTGKKEMYILLLGALIIGLICVSLIHYIQLYSKLKFDSAIALMLSSFFGFGLILLTYDYKNQYPKSFSGGMKRRLNIACSIAHTPELLIMDEPTVGIDPQSRNNILETIKTLKKSGTSIIYVSHYM